MYIVNVVVCHVQCESTNVPVPLADCCPTVDQPLMEGHYCNSIRQTVV